MQRLVNILRGGENESYHCGSIVVVDSNGRILAFAGDPSERTFLRSAAKPFQALSLLQTGLADEFDLSSDEIALMTGSHGGEAKHVSTAAALLRKGELDESDLLCGAHPPYDEKALADLRQSGEPPSPLHNNCSGKHASMLLAARLLEPSALPYIERSHPIQQNNLETLATFCGVEPESIALGVDGCGIPTFHLSLYRTALAYARFAATSHSPSAPGALARYASGARQLFDAMTGSAAFVAGNWSITTPLMESFEGALAAKEGAEGFYGIAIPPPLAARIVATADVGENVAVGIAMKISDGSMTRGRDPVILRTLEILGIPAEDDGRLDRFRDMRIRNCAGRVIGEIRAEFDLTWL